MNIRYTSALLLVLSFLASSLLLAVAPQVSFRSQGQNIVHTVVQQAKTHVHTPTLPAPDTPTKPAHVSPIINVHEQPSPSTFFSKKVATVTPNNPANTEQPEQQIADHQDPVATAQLAKTIAQIVPDIKKNRTASRAALKETLPTKKRDTSSAPLKETSSEASEKKSSLQTPKPKKLKDTPSTLITPKKKKTGKKTPSTVEKPTHTSSKNNAFTPRDTQKATSQNAQAARATSIKHSTQIVHTPAITQHAQTTANKKTKKTFRNALPTDTQSLPITKKITTKNKITSCSTTTPVFEKYPAIDDTTPSDSAPFEKYPTIEDEAQPSSAIFYTYPAIDCVSAPTQETKNNSAPLNNYAQDNASLGGEALNSKNVATEVHNIDSFSGGKNIAGNFALQPEIMRSFRPHALTHALFGCDLYNDTTIHIRGSALARNEEKDWLADYFYLSNNYESIVCFTPRVTSFLADMSLFIDLNSWFNGCFLRVQSPLTWTKWDLGMCEKIINSGDVAGAQGWRGNWATVDNNLLSSFTDYSCWEKAGTSYVDSVGLAHPLYAAKLCPCGKTKTALADLHVDVGFYAYQADHYHVGLYARGVIPTGTRPTGEFLFEPIIGNGHHGELGGGLNGYAQLWSNRVKSKELSLYVDGSITHLFSSHQQRVFDLKNHGPLSRYLLLTNSATAPSSITPAANITRSDIQVSVPVQVDLVALINYATDVFSWNVGYNFWARSCEKINCCKISTSKLCDNCSAVSGLNGVTWKPYVNSTIKNLGASSLAPALSQDNLDLNASRTKGSSHKLFTSFNYAWTELDDTVVPFLGIGTEIEFGNTTSGSNTACCKRVSLSQWGLWLRAGTEF